ncbi:MAG: hypothetical protein PHP42_14125, partial [Bacteroidota bacterium]|nr:hypothetical protein [Bacteroidota bacterium]
MDNHRNTFRLRTIILLSADVFLLIICFLHVPSLTHRAVFPFSFDEHDSSTVLLSSTPTIESGDKLLSVGYSTPKNNSELQFLADLHSAGDSIEVKFERDHIAKDVVLHFNNYYASDRFIILTFFVGIMIIIVSVLMILAIPREPLIVLLHNLFVSLGSALMLSWGTVALTLISYVIVTLFFSSYSLFGVTFFWFTYSMWNGAFIPINWKRVSSYVLAAAFSITLTLLYISSIKTQSLQAYQLFSNAWFIFHLVIVLSITVGMILLVLSTRKAVTQEERVRSRWIAAGIIIGGIPFAV